MALWDVPAKKAVEHSQWTCAQGGEIHPSEKLTEICRGASDDSRACGWRKGCWCETKEMLLKGLIFNHTMAQVKLQEVIHRIIEL